MHFYKLFERKCVLALCTHPPYNDKNPPSVFFYLLKSLPLSEIEPSVRVTSHRRRPLPRVLIDSSVLAQTALVSYLCHQLFHCRSRCIHEWFLSNWGVLLLDVIMNIAVVIYSVAAGQWGAQGHRPPFKLAPFNMLTISKTFIANIN